MAKRKNNLIKNNKNKYLIFMLLIVLFHVLIKLFFTIPYPKPVIYGDELLYKENARYLFELTGRKVHNHKSYYLSGYPPLYPLMLTPSFLGGENFYLWMKIINVLLSSLTIIPVWLISRIYLSKQKSMYPVIISTLLPFHYSFPKFIMSENLFYPIFLFTIYFFLKAKMEPSFRWSLLSGIFLGLSILTRYFAGIMIPILIILWWFPINKKRGRTKIFHFLLFLTSFLVLLLPWIIYGPNSFLITSAGYIKGSVNQGQRQVGNFYQSLFWFLSYLSCFILLISPFLSLVLGKVTRSLKQILKSKEGLFLILVNTITLTFILLAMRHSSFSDLSSSYLLGRYITYLSALWIIFAFINTKRLERVKLNLKKIIVASFLSVFLITISYLAIIKGVFWNVSGWFIMDHLSPDISIFKTSLSILTKIDRLILFYVCFINLVPVFIFYKMKKNLSFIVFILASIFYLFSDYKLLYTTISKNKKDIITGNDIFLILHEIHNDGKKFIIYNDTKEADRSIDFSLRFFGADNKKFEVLNANTINNVSSIKEGGLFITKKELKNIGKLKNYNENYFLYEVP